MTRALEILFFLGPLIFGLLFLWPLASQMMMRAGMTYGPATFLGAALALPFAIVAQWRGRWL